MISKEEFDKLYYGTFPVSYEKDALSVLAEEYNKRCDEFDNIICTGKYFFDDDNFEKVPKDKYERTRMESHAESVFQEIINRPEVRSLGYTTKELKKSFGHYKMRAK